MVSAVAAVLEPLCMKKSMMVIIFSLSPFACWANNIY